MALIADFSRSLRDEVTLVVSACRGNSSVLHTSATLTCTSSPGWGGRWEGMVEDGQDGHGVQGTLPFGTGRLPCGVCGQKSESRPVTERLLNLGLRSELALGTTQET